MSNMKDIYTAYNETEGTTLDRVQAACAAALPHKDDDRLSRSVYVHVVSDLFYAITPGLECDENDPEAINESLEYPELDESLDINSFMPYYAEQFNFVAKYGDMGSEVYLGDETHTAEYSIRELLAMMAQVTLDEHVQMSLEKIRDIWLTIHATEFCEDIAE